MRDLFQACERIRHDSDRQFEFCEYRDEGVRFVVTDREAFDSTRFGVELAAALQKLYPGRIDFEKCRHLIGSRWLVEDLKAGRDASVLWSHMASEAEIFSERRKPYLLY